MRIYVVCLNGFPEVALLSHEEVDNWVVRYDGGKNVTVFPVPIEAPMMFVTPETAALLLWGKPGGAFACKACGKGVEKGPGVALCWACVSQHRG